MNSNADPTTLICMSDGAEYGVSGDLDAIADQIVRSVNNKDMLPLELAPEEGRVVINPMQVTVVRSRHEEGDELISNDVVLAEELRDPGYRAALGKFAAARSVPQAGDDLAELDLSNSELTQHLVSCVDDVLAAANDRGAGIDAILGYLAARLADLDRAREGLGDAWKDDPRVIPVEWYEEAQRRIRELEERMRQLAPDDEVMDRGRVWGSDVDTRW